MMERKEHTRKKTTSEVNYSKQKREENNIQRNLTLNAK